MGSDLPRAPIEQDDDGGGNGMYLPSEIRTFPDVWSTSARGHNYADGNYKEGATGN